MKHTINPSRRRFFCANRRRIIGLRRDAGLVTCHGRDGRDAENDTEKSIGQFSPGCRTRFDL